MSEANVIPKAFRLSQWYPEIDKTVLASLEKHYDELVKFNKNLNLVSAKTLPFADAIHFADAYLASRVIMTAYPKITEIYDFGSGGGFPGIVFAIMYPQVRVITVESDPKKGEFLKHLVNVLGLKNVSALTGSLENLGADVITYCMSRGLANISKSILMCRKQVKKGGVYFHLKSEEWGMEVGEIPTQLCSIWSPSLVGEYKLPIGGAKFSVVKTEKIG